MTPIRSLLFFVFLSNICLAQQQKQAQQLDSIFSVMYEQHQFNGAVLIAEKGKTIFKKGYGYSNEGTRQRNDAGTIFELGSCSKQFTATAIVLLRRQGKLSYEDNLSKYLPELSFWDKVTIYDLLRHTSGVPEYLADMSRDWDKTKIATNADLVRYYTARKDTLEFAPRSRHRYCNTNYALLASIVERVSGETYARFLSEHIFKPLKMTHTFVYNRREQPRHIPNHATGYVWARNSFRKVTPEHPESGDSTVYFLDGVVGAAKVNSSAEDLYKWIMALKNNTFLTQSEFEEMTAVTKTSAGKNIPYGFGFDLSKGDNKFAFGHTGSWDGYVSFIYQDVVKDRTIITLQNFHQGAYPFNNIMQVLAHQPITKEYKKKVLLPAAGIEKYAGVYTDPQNPEEEHIITCQDGHLFYNTRKLKWDMRFFPISANEFQGIRQGGRDGVLRFTTADNGDTRLEMLEDGQVIGNGVRKMNTQ